MNQHPFLTKFVVCVTMALGASAFATPGMASTLVTSNVRIVSSSTTCASWFCFKPAFLKVLSGGKVTWTNRSPARHTVTRCTVAACGVSGGTGTDTGFGSGILKPTDKYSFTFHRKGSYVYYCTIHGYAVMHGKVVVG